MQGLSHPDGGSDNELGTEINKLIDAAHQQMNDDFNTPMALARLFEMVTKVNGLKEGHLSMSDLSAATLDRMKSTFNDFIYTIMGLKDETDEGGNNNGITNGLMDLILEIRQDARTNKDWGTSDKIRDTLKELDIVVKDGKDETSWSKI